MLLTFKFNKKEYDIDPLTPLDEQIPGLEKGVTYQIISSVVGAETDPHGKDPHEPGAKLDYGKVRPALVLGGFARALNEVSKVGTYGAQKYTEHGWRDVPNGIARYADAAYRHGLAVDMGESHDKDTGLLHQAHKAWNELAVLDLLLRKQEK